MDGTVPLLDERIDRIRRFLDGVAADRPSTLLELKRRLAAELGLEAGPETLQALAAATESAEPLHREIGLRSAADHLLLTICAREAWETSPADAAPLAAIAEMLPSVLLAHREAREEIRRTIATVGRMHREQSEKLHLAFDTPEEPILAAVVLVPEIERLARAFRDGSLPDAAPSLSADDVAILAAGCAANDDASKPERALVDGVALRTLFESHVIAAEGSLSV